VRYDQTVIAAARTGDVFGFGGQVVTAPERSFRGRLADAPQP
jgi:hypothetical protein